MGKSTPQSGAFFSIRKRILVFAIFATLVPSMMFGWITYYKTHALLLKQAEQELQVELDRSKRDLDAWFQQMLDDLHVFSSSFVLANNLTLHLESSSAEKQDRSSSPLAPEQQISEFLQLVQGQVSDYHHLLVLDTTANLIAQFPQLEFPTGIAADWANHLQPDWITVFERRSTSESPILNLGFGVPIVSTSEVSIGMLIAEIPISRMNAALETASGNGTEILLTKEDGEVLMSSLAWKDRQIPGSSHGKKPVDPDVASGLVRYRNFRGVDVVSLSVPLSQLPWRLVIEKPYQLIFADIDRLRGYSLLLMLGLLVGFSLLAYLVSQSILLPLNRLIKAAATVAKGDLNTRLITSRSDELGFAMTVFNDMVERLRINRDELERLSVTDSLTGLYNRKYVMEALHLQFERYRRSGLVFSLLMIDVDHFKRINDQLGHLAGDAALRQIGHIFRSILRSVDVAGRYGGEEFLVILEQASARQALDTAERIRAVSAQAELRYNGESIRFTVSIGVATVADNQEDTPDSLIQRADRELYRAKNNGRNRVMGSDLPRLDEGRVAQSEKTIIKIR